MSKKQTILGWLCLVCMILGAAISFISSVPYHSNSFAETHSVIGISLITIAYLLWVVEANPINLYFGVVLGGWAALIDNEHVVMGLVGLSLTCIARFIYFKLEGR